MTGFMKERWIDKYRSAADLIGPSRDVLVAFNANIDEVMQVEELDLDLSGVEPRELEKASGMEQLKSMLKYCIENSENREIELSELDHGFENSDEHVGGQAGIMANFLSRLGNGVIFYTPFLSEELAEKMDEKVLYPVVEGDFTLKNVRDAANTDRTKRNLIFEYSGEQTGRVIFSRQLKGFGPYFRKGVEDSFPEIEENTDRIILSGFHDVEGNVEAKLKKSGQQIAKLEKPVHLEFVYRNDEVTQLVAEHVLPEADSIGMDEEELGKLIDLLNLELENSEQLSLGDAFHAAKQLIDRFDMQRCHVHTYRFHACVVKEDYDRSTRRIRDAMLFGELCAIKNAEKGEIPGAEDLNEFDMEDKHIHELKDLEHFQDYFDIHDFVETGTAEVEGHRIAAIPTIIHEDPERLVGMGDLISAGAFVAELNQLP
ncbi:MAG: ADP-dependent glucokinase/phosphofructokinase [Candidatus Nanohaloarchaea archaeon]